MYDFEFLKSRSANNSMMKGLFGRLVKIYARKGDGERLESQEKRNVDERNFALAKYQSFGNVG